MPTAVGPSAALLAGGLLAFATGCSDQAIGRPVDRAAIPPDNPPPVIDPIRLAYDPDLRTIHLYELITDPRTGRRGTWQVWMPEQTIAYPTGPTFQVPRGMAEADVVIRAADPPGPPSPG
jgi:hypothetical protein